MIVETLLKISCLVIVQAVQLVALCCVRYIRQVNRILSMRVGSQTRDGRIQFYYDFTFACTERKSVTMVCFSILLLSFVNSDF